MSWFCKTSKIWSRQSAFLAAFLAALVSAFMSLPSPGLQDHEEHDSDHQERRHLVPPAIIAGRSGVFVCLELLAPAAVQVMDQGEADNQREFDLPPAGMPPVALPGEQQAEDPDQDQGRIHDAAQEAAFHDFERLALLGTFLGVG